MYKPRVQPSAPFRDYLESGKRGEGMGGREGRGWRGRERRKGVVSKSRTFVQFKYYREIRV